MNRYLERALFKDHRMGKSVGITAVSKRTRLENPGTRVVGHGRSRSDYNSFNQDRS